MSPGIDADEQTRASKNSEVSPHSRVDVCPQGQLDNVETDKDTGSDHPGNCPRIPFSNDANSGDQIQNANHKAFDNL